MFDVTIIGAGPAGLTAALYSLRAGLKVAIIENNIFGGQVSITNIIENYPGISKISGPELSNLMYEQVMNAGGKFIFDSIESVDLKQNIKSIKTSRQNLQSKCVIIANGLKRRKLGCPGEQEFSGKGVSYCATCDGAFFKNKDVLIVGGGNTAVEDALYLSNICKNVSIVIRRDHFRAQSYLVDSLNKKENIDIIKETTIKEIIGNTVVSSVVLMDKNNNQTQKDISGVFISIGYEPNNQIFKNQINLDDKGYFISDESCSTNIPGVYVAGDCRTKPLRQIVTAVSDGAVASNQVVKYLTSWT